MNRDTELTAHLLQYMHDNHYFKNMEEMAEAFGISKRHLQRLINDADNLKGGNIALSKILQYFGRHNIPFDPVLIEFIGNTARQSVTDSIRPEKPYMRLYLPKPENLTEEGIGAYEYCREFIGLVSSYICPDCRAWCNPWDGADKLQVQDCSVAQLANSLLQSVAASYTKRT